MTGFMERWRARLRNDPKPLDSYDAELKAARADTPHLPKVKVDPFTKHPVCPKCGSAGITTTFFAGVHTDCPHLYMFDPTPAHELLIWGLPAPRVVVARERGREAAVEHLDRRCCNCVYGWVTAIRPPRRP